MSKISLKYNDKNYDLEYSRQSVKTMEAQGFVLEQIGERPMTMIPLLFEGAFYKNCRGTKRAVIDEIFENIPDKDGLMQALLEMYAETLSCLTDSNEQGNVTWARVE